MSPSWAARVRARLAGLGVLAPLGTLRRKPVALAASFALCAVVLAASVALARRTPPDTQPARCPSANELVVGTWSWNAFEEELDADGTYRIRLPLRVFRSLTLSSSLIELKGRYVLASDGTLSIALGKSTTRYVAFVDRRDALIYYARSGVVSVHRRRSPAVAMPAGCKANTARLPGSWTASDGAMLTVGSDAASFQLASGPRRAVTDASLFVPATSLPMLVLTDARHDESWKGYLDVHPGRLFRRSSPPGGGR